MRCSGGQVQLLLYDFSCTYQPTDDERRTLARLIQATVYRNESPWPLFLKLGSDQEYLELLADKLPALCRVLFEPFCAEYPSDPADWRLGERVSDILGPGRLNFRIAGPAGLVFLLRAFYGLTYYLQGLEHLFFGVAPSNHVQTPWHLSSRSCSSLCQPSLNMTSATWRTTSRSESAKMVARKSS